MLPEIRAFPSEEFYYGRLKDSAERAAREFPGRLEFLQTNNHLFIDVKHGREAIINHSYYNEEEIKYARLTAA